MVPKITFVIPVFNRSEYLKETLISLCTQTIEDWACIVVDDYSTEDIRSIVESFNDSRISYVRNCSAKGVSGARNFGNTLVTTDWIALADSDDINLPRRVEVSQKYISDFPEADVFYSALYSIDDGTYQVRNWRHGSAYDREKLYKKNFIANNTALYRKESIEKIGGYDETLVSAEDYDVWLKFADIHATFIFIDEPLVLYRRHKGQFASEIDGQNEMRKNADFVRDRHAKFV